MLACRKCYFSLIQVATTFKLYSDYIFTFVELVSLYKLSPTMHPIVLSLMGQSHKKDKIILLLCKIIYFMSIKI